MRYLVIDAAASNAPFAARLTTTAFTMHSGRNTPPIKNLYRYIGHITKITALQKLSKYFIFFKKEAVCNVSHFKSFCPTQTVPQKAGYYTHGILIHAGNLQVLSSEL
jgi:hypothetical protein